MCHIQHYITAALIPPAAEKHRVWCQHALTTPRLQTPRSASTDSRWITGETQEREELAKCEQGCGHLAGDEWNAPVPSPAGRLGAVETEISQMKLMRTSGGGSTYSLSRLSSLWLLVHSDTLPCLCKTLVFLRPPKGVQQWLNTPKWPYQLFYHFSCGWWWWWWWMMRIPVWPGLAWPSTRGGLELRDYGRPSDRCVSGKKVKEGKLWSSRRGYLHFKVTVFYPYSSFVLYHSRLVSALIYCMNYNGELSCHDRNLQRAHVAPCWFIFNKSKSSHTSNVPVGTWDHRGIK